jgi:hypothetical protein
MTTTTEKPRWLVNQLARQKVLVAVRRAMGCCVTCGEPAEATAKGTVFARCSVCRLAQVVKRDATGTPPRTGTPDIPR